MAENTHNGFEYVDLGLPSGLKWATCNVGAASEQGYGKFFQWGDTVGYEGDNAEEHSNWETTPFNNGKTDFDKKSMLINKNRVLNDNGVLRKAFDAAHVHMGGNWRMPTREEFVELIEHTTSKFIRNYNNSGVNGVLLASEINGKTMFIPASGYLHSGSHIIFGSYGYLWSSSFSYYDPCSASYLVFLNSNVSMALYYRYYGFPVRGVF